MGYQHCTRPASASNFSPPRISMWSSISRSRLGEPLQYGWLQTGCYAAEPLGDRAGRIRRTSRRVAGIKEHPNGHLHPRVIRPLLRRHGTREVWFRRRTYRVKPSANVHLSVGFPAEVPCSGRICGLRIPFENSELRLAALNHKPVNRIAGYRSADFTSEFLKRGHKFLIVSELASTCSTRIAFDPKGRHIVTHPSGCQLASAIDSWAYK
jgi:hypothetical protein